MAKDYEELSSKFEAVKVSMNQDKNGHMLKLAVHPNDTPEDIMRDPVGTRYLVVLVRMNDEGEAVPSPSMEEGKKAIRLAGTLCSDDNFQQYLVHVEEADEMSEMAATVALRRMLNITSRKELMHNKEARAKLLGIRDEFANALRQGKLIR
jgi:hypothetical protein